MSPPVIRLNGANPDEPNVVRAYKHEKCGCETAAGGDALVLLECPFRPVDSTLCSGCGEYAPLDQVCWSDSGERISLYRKRVMDSIPFWRRLYLLLMGNAYEGAVNLNLDKQGRVKEDSHSLVS